MPAPQVRDVVRADPGGRVPASSRPFLAPTVAVVGLGRVGLPLAVEFGRHFRTVGYDLSEERVEACRRHADSRGEVSGDQFRAARRLEVTTDSAMLREADFIIVAVPSRVDDARKPGLSPLVSASAVVGRNLRPGATVVFESMAYPGATEEVCVPVLERESGLGWKRDFFVGYSPERINPGDRERTLTRIVKIVSGDTPRTLERVAEVYGRVITAGVHRARSIKGAEAAKVIRSRAFARDPIADPAAAVREFAARSAAALAALLLPGGVFVDVKGQVDAGALRERRFYHWRP